RILQQGGNAADAALAVAAALNVVEPHMSGMGGDGFALIYRRDSGRVEVINATGPAPLQATRAAYQPGGIPMKGVRSVSIPGLVDGWLRLHSRYGQLQAAAAFAPAIDLAANGFPIGNKLAQAIAAQPALHEFAPSAAIFAPRGRPLQAGELLVQRDLAHSFRLVATEGRDAFYAGPIATAIVRCSEHFGGLLTREEFTRYSPLEASPISTRYRDWTVYEAPPNSSGHVVLQILNMLEQFDLRSLGCNTAAAIQLMVEAKRLAFADRERYLADPGWTDIPLAGMLAKEYAQQRARLIDLDRAMAEATPGAPWRYQAEPLVARSPRRSHGPEEDTTCFVVADGDGNAVCQLQSLQSAFGSGLVAEGTGILLNNRMTYWHLEADHVDRLEPGKRVRHTMNPVMVFRDGRLVLLCGTPGADTQVQTNVQVLTHVLEFGFNVQEAVEAPRWRHLQNPTESEVPHTCAEALNLEARFPDDVAEGLRRRGQPVQMIGAWEATGSEVMIQVDPETGALAGGADPRRDAYAIGY
ncbi:MAG TPA: gamma-glutamyltransferase, partial [Chloroflexota bacterium]|nr:gamma-glutamyltransferase [Chloroflexota bacterium]